MSRLKPYQRRAQLINAGAKLAEEQNLYDVNLSDIAASCGCATGTVLHYFNSLMGWRDAVIHDAIKYERLRVIAQALIARDEVALALNSDLKERALISQVNA